MDARLRDTVSLFLGNFFLLFLQSRPPETLKIKLPPNFSHPLSARFPRVLMKQKQLLIWLLIPPDSLHGCCAGHLRGRALSKNPRPADCARSGHSASTSRASTEEHRAHDEQSRKACLVSLRAIRKGKAARFGALSIHKEAFNILSCYGPSLKYCCVFTVVEVLRICISYEYAIKERKVMRNFPGSRSQFYGP